MKDHILGAGKVELTPMTWALEKTQLSKSLFSLLIKYIVLVKESRH